MRVLLTGATGFLGGVTAQTLAAVGHSLVLLARRPEALTPLPLGATALAGDLRDASSLGRAMQGCDAVVHLAALVKRWAPDRAEFDRVNVEGLTALLDAARAARIGRVVYCSSFFALGPTDGQIGDEEHPHDGKPRNDYERTKWLADGLARQRQAAGEPLVVVYPGVVYGKGRLTDGNVMGQAVRDLLRGKLPGTIGPGDRRWCLALVDDVARGIALVLDRAPDGARYLLGGENLTVRQALAICAEAAGVTAPKRVIPFAVAGLFGRLLRLRADLFGIAPMLTDEEVEIYRHEWAYSSARAEQALGYRITPAQEGLSEMTRWIKASLA